MQTQRSSPALTLAALGVVYGDIGTSVLYALKEVFGSGHVSLTTEHIYGVLSLVVWTVTVIVSIKYVMLVLRADNQGEGGLVAMLALASKAVASHPRLRSVLMVVGIFGACLFYGDGVITPAISVLSAVEGLAVLSPQLSPAVVPLTLVILLALFLVQKRGTAGIGRWFGPVMLLWFVSLAALGLWQIAQQPHILWALSPHHAVLFVLQAPGTAFVLLGAVVLCVTGAEALYADPPGVVWRGHAGLSDQLPGSRRFAAGATAGRGQPVFCHGSQRTAAAAGSAGHSGHGDCLASPDYGGF